MGRAPLWCHARCAAFALALALACLSGARALSSDVLAVGDVPSNVHKSFPVVGRPRTFPPGPTVTGTVRLGTVRERAFPSRADTAGVPGTDADAFPVDARGAAAREDARGWAEAVVEDVARAGEGAGDAPAHAKTEDAGDVCLTPRRFDTAQLDLASAVTAIVPALVAALAVSASAALALRAASSASSARRCLGGVAREACSPPRRSRTATRTADDVSLCLGPRFRRRTPRLRADRRGCERRRALRPPRTSKASNPARRAARVRTRARRSIPRRIARRDLARRGGSR